MAQIKSATDFSAPRAKVWEFASDSNPDKKYHTILYSNGTASCNCPGWTRHKAAGGNRTCKHIDSVVMGTADANCVAQNDYRADGASEAVTQVLAANKEKAQATKIKFGQRKLAI